MTLLDDELRRARDKYRSNGQDESGELDESWLPVDLGPVLAGEHPRIAPSVLRRDDMRYLLYAGKVNGIHGADGDGKTWVALLTIAQELERDRHVVDIDFEDDAHTLVERLRELGVADDAIAERLHYVCPSAPFDVAAVEHVETIVCEHAATLVTIDSLGEAFGTEGVNEDRDDEVGPWLRRVARRLASTGVCVLLVDHTTKAKDNPLFPSGSKRKRAAITGAMYYVTAPAPLTRESGGKLRLTTAKDRHGHYKRGEPAAYVDFHRYPDSGLSVKVWAPLPTDEPDGVALLDLIARIAVRAAKELDEPTSLRGLIEVMKKNTKASRDTLIAGVERAVTLGALSTEAGPRRAVLHTYVHDLEPPNDC
jgi:hypothetical protein